MAHRDRGIPEAVLLVYKGADGGLDEVGVFGGVAVHGPHRAVHLSLQPRWQPHPLLHPGRS